MGRPFPWGRAITGVVALGTFIFATSFLFQWWTFSSDCADAEKTELASFPNAFGAKGTYRAPINLKYGFTCKEKLVIEHDGMINHSLEDIESTVEGLDADLSIRATSGTPTLDDVLTSEVFAPGPKFHAEKKVLPTYYISRLPAGHYDLKLVVNEPSRRLAAVNHRVVMRYSLCGIEYLAAAANALVAIVLYVVSGILSVGILLVNRRMRRDRSFEAPTGLGP